MAAPSGRGGLRPALTLAVATVGLVLSSAAGISVIASDPTSHLSKVALMLEEMKAKSVTLKQQADVQYQEVATACTDSLATNEQDLQASDLQIQTLEADVQKYDVDIKQMVFDISQYQIDMERDAQDLELNHQLNANLTATFHRDLAAYEMAIGAAERAKLTLQAQQPAVRPAAAALLETARRAVEGLELLPTPPRAGRNLRSAAGLLERDAVDYTPDDGGIAKDEHIFDEFDGVSVQAEAFSGQMTTFDGIIDQVLVLFRTTKDNLVQQQAMTKKDFTETVAALEQQITTNRASLATAQETLASSKSTLISKQQELSDARESDTATKAYRVELKSACDQKADDYKEMNTLRANEITTLAKAAQLLRDAGAAADGGAAAAAALLRREVHVRRGGLPGDEGEEKVLGFLRVEARQLASVSLQRLAGEVEAVVDNGLAAAAEQAADAAGPEARKDALDKVKDMIQNLVTKLLSQAAAEASHNSWCSTELKKNNMSQTGSQADIKKHSATVKQLTAALAQLELEIADLNTTIARMANERTEAVQERKESRDENLATIADAQQSSQALDAALMLLEEYYKNAAKSVALVGRTQSVGHGHVQQNTSAKHVRAVATGKKELPEKVSQAAVSGPQVEEGKGVAAMLEVVRDGFKELESKTTKKEGEAAALYTEELRDHDVMAATAEKDRDFKVGLQQTYTTQVADTASDLESATQALADAKTTYEQLKPPCVTGETYEERAAKRDQEMSALKEALEMLDQYSQEMGYALVQGSSAAGAYTAPLQAVKSVVQWGEAAVASAVVPAAPVSAVASPAVPAAAVATPAAPAVPAVAAAFPAAPTIVAAAPVAPVAPVGAVAVPVAPVVAAAVPVAQAVVAAPAAHVAVAARRHTEHAAVAAHAADGKLGEDPLADVAALLEGMHAEVLSDLAADERVYDDTQSWCDKTITQSRAAIEAADARDQELMSSIEVSVQGKASLEVQSARLKDELTTEAKSLDQQESIRQRAAAQFHESEKELLEATYALSHALEVLHSRYSNAGENNRDYAAEREQLEDSGEFQESGDDWEPQLNLVGVAGELKKALSALPPQEANLVNSLAMSAELQAFLVKPTELFPDAAAPTPWRGGRASLSLAVSKVTASPEGQQIFGILQQLLDTFKADLKAVRESEAKDLADYTALRESKLSQVQALQNSITLKEAEFAKDSSSNADAKEELASVRASRKAEYQHLLEVQEHCRQVEAEFNRRNGTRHEELGSIDEALEILAGDGGAEPPMEQVGFHAVAVGAGGFHALPAAPVASFHAAPLAVRPHLASRMSTTTTAAPKPESVVDQYLKLHTGTVRKHVPSAASEVIEALRSRRARHSLTALAARQVLAGPRPMPVAAVMTSPPPTPPAVAGRKSLNALAMRSRLRRAVEPNAITAAINDKFGIVGEMLDKVRHALTAEKQREVEFHDRCKDEAHRSEAQLERRMHDEQMLTSAIQRLDSVAAETETQVSEVTGQIQELAVSLEEAQYARSNESAVYDTTIEEQEAIQAKLHQAMHKLSVYYGKPALLELGQEVATASSTTTTRPGQFAKSEKHSGGHGIISILQLMVEQSEALVKSMRETEQESRDAYIANVASSEEAASMKKRNVIAMSATKSNAELEKEQTQARLDGVETEIQEIHAFIQIVEERCGWIMQNFVTSQAARGQQIENTRKAKEQILGAMYNGQ